jgi:hypothetical protein
MVNAATQLDLPFSPVVTGPSETQDVNKRALAFLRGGTGASVRNEHELATHLNILRPKGGRKLITKMNQAGYYTIGVDAPTEYGTAATEDTVRSFYQNYTYANTLNAVAGVSLGNLIQRRHGINVLFTFDVQLFTLSRFWCGLFSADPSASLDPNTTSGIGIRYDATSDTGGSFWRLWGCDASGTSTVKTADGSVSGTEAVQVTASVQFRLLIRNLPTSLGVFQFWMQRSSDDSDASLTGRWYFLGSIDTSSEKGPAAATWLQPWLTHTNINTTGNTPANRKLRVHSIEIM